MRSLPPEVMKAFLRKEMEKASIIDFEKIGMWQVADEDLLREFADKLYWYSVFYYIQCSQNFIREALINYYGGITRDTEYYILRQNSVDEKFIEEIKDLVSWEMISTLDLSEEFVRKHYEDLNWYSVSRNPNLSAKFLEEYEDKLNWAYVIHNNKHVTKEMKERHKDEIYWKSDR